MNGEEVPVVASWDVVNEVFDGATLRNSLFSRRMGDDYAAKLFQWAREADEDVKLFIMIIILQENRPKEMLL